MLVQTIACLKNPNTPWSAVENWEKNNVDVQKWLELTFCVYLSAPVHLIEPDFELIIINWNPTNFLANDQV